MIGLYRPKVLLVKSSNGDYLEKSLADPGLSILVASDLDGIKSQLAQANIDIIVASINKMDLKIPKLFKDLPENISLVLIDEEGGVIPNDWKIGDIVLRKKTAQSNLIKICIELQEQKKELRKAA